MFYLPLKAPVARIEHDKSKSDIQVAPSEMLALYGLVEGLAGRVSKPKLKRQILWGKLHPECLISVDVR